MKVFGRAMLIGLCLYVVGVILGVVLVKLFSRARPDKSMEAAMTGFFYVGPALAVVGFVGALVYQLVRHDGQ
jgi:hypothetical protein